MNAYVVTAQQPWARTLHRRVTGSRTTDAIASPIVAASMLRGVTDSSARIGGYRGREQPGEKESGEHRADLCDCEDGASETASTAHRSRVWDQAYPKALLSTSKPSPAGLP